MVRDEWTLIAWLIAGIIFRVIVARSGWGNVDSDESTGMLMANQAAHGHFFALFWGENYGGTLMTWVEAPVVAIFGLHVTLFRVANIVVGAVDAILVRIVAGKIISKRAATAAAALFWLFPPDWVRWSVHEYVWWVPGLAIALATLLCCLRWDECRSDRRLWPIGLFLGATFWLYPLLGALVLGPFAAVAWATRRRLVSLAKLVALLPVGALPWLWTNLAHHFVSFERSQQSGATGTIRLRHAITQVLPTSLLTSTGVHPSPRVISLLGILIVAVTLTFVLVQFTRHHWRLALVGVPILIWPFILAGSGVRDGVGEYRYAFVLIPVFAVLSAYGLEILSTKVTTFDRIRLSSLAVLAATAVTVNGGAQVTDTWAHHPHGILDSPQSPTISNNSTGPTSLPATGWHMY